ncbi:MAG: NAD(P)/FAD-dependent oxidoreductase [Candidatus Nomurabacteria bacterium]|jgi:dihydrolipoamide dehydrogenase|nr:NAD(P)/FAD-dependent oxidoreductase [Candidatus Nomurabacteria bacterium]
MAQSKFNFDLVIIGSGAGGSTAAVAAAKAGLKTALVESGTFGGTALNSKDIPLNALLQTAHLYDQARRGSRFGLSSTTLRYNYPAINHFKDIAIKRGGGGGNQRFYSGLGIHTYSGLAHFLSPSEVSVGGGSLSAKHFLIATGARFKKPDIKNLDAIKYLTPTDVPNIIRPPRSTFVVGGGRSGVELAQYLAELGSKVLVADKAARLLPNEDEEVGVLIGKVLNDKYGIKVLTKSKVVSVTNGAGVKKVTFLRGGEEKTVSVDEVLVATGLEPNTDLGLENAGVAFTNGGITVNEYLQTSNKRIYAVGDVVNAHHSTSRAMGEGQLAVENLARRNKLPLLAAGIPSITNTYPEIASVGLTEDDCLKRDTKVQKSLVPLSAVARSNVSDFHDGFVKIVANDHGKILGSSIVAPQAGTMIHEIALAIRHDILASDLAEMPHAFLSWSEAIQIAANKLK